MTVEEIFSQLAAHMIKGLMIHSQMSDYYGFLGLKGYQECHKYHYFAENANYKRIANYYLKHYDKLVLDLPFENPDVIPESWFKYTRHNVNENTRKSAIQAGIEKWVDWETQTKKLYEYYYQELCGLGEIAAAMEIRKYIKDVDEELATAYQKHLELKAIDFDINVIMEKQEEKYRKYKKKLKEINLC